jgi:hypothetical protein
VDAELDSMVRESVKIRLAPTLGVAVDFPDTWAGREGLIVGMRLEVVAKGEVIASVSAWWDSTLVGVRGLPMFQNLQLGPRDETAALARALRDDPDARIRIAGDGEAALRSLIGQPEATGSYWKGVIEAPLTEFLRE